MSHPHTQASPEVARVRENKRVARVGRRVGVPARTEGVRKALGTLVVIILLSSVRLVRRGPHRE